MKDITQLLVVFMLISVAHPNTIVSVSEKATITLTILAKTTDILQPSGSAVIQKSDNKCTLLTADRRYKLLSPECESVVIFEIQNVQTTDAGDYKCSAESCKQKLIVLGTPTEATITASTDDLRTSRDITLTCTSQSTTKPVDHGLIMTYIWIKNEKRLNKTSPSVLLQSVQRDQFNDSYVCTASENPSKSSMPSDVYRLKPKYLIQPTATVNDSSNKTVFVSNGDAVVLKCDVDAYPMVTYFNVYNNKKFVKAFGNTRTLTYTKQWNCSETISLQCYARNEIRTSYSNIIKVQGSCKPMYDSTITQPVVFFTNYISVTNHKVDIKMIGHPIPDYVVMKKTSTGLVSLSPSIDLNTKEGNLQLFFRNLLPDDFGEYQLNANNSEGTFVGHFSIKVVSAPVKVMAWSETPNSVHLSWHTTFDAEDLTTASYSIYLKYVGINWKKLLTVLDSGTTITHVISSLKPNTQYMFMVQGKLGYRPIYGLFSKVVTADTINIGDEPQVRPKDQENPTLAISQVPRETDKEPTPTSTALPIGFGASMAIGLAIGVLAAMIVMTIILVTLKLQNRLTIGNTIYDQPRELEVPPQPIYSTLENQLGV